MFYALDAVVVLRSVLSDLIAMRKAQLCASPLSESVIFLFQSGQSIDSSQPWYCEWNPDPSFNMCSKAEDPSHWRDGSTWAG